jgi:hypothetical protein
MHACLSLWLSASDSASGEVLDVRARVWTDLLCMYFFETIDLYIITIFLEHVWARISLSKKSFRIQPQLC